MTFALGSRSLSFCTHVDPRLIAVAKAAVAVSTQDFGFTAEQSRTVAEEHALLLKGASHSMHSHHLINDGSLTWEPLQSAEGYSGAVDAVPWDGSKFVWDVALCFPIAAAFKQASISLGFPVTWGGCWGKLLTDIPGSSAAALQAGAKGGWDFVHFELGRN